MRTTTTRDGWMDRVLAQLPGAHGPTEAVSLGPTVPRILSGRMPIANIPLGRAAARPMPLDNPKIEEAFDRLYNGRDAISRAYQNGRFARKKLIAELEQDMQVADADAPGASDLARLNHQARIRRTRRMGHARRRRFSQRTVVESSERARRRASELRQATWSRVFGHRCARNLGVRTHRA